MQLFKKQLEPNLENTTKRIDNLWNKVATKVDISAFNEFKEYSSHYIHKKEVDELYLNIIPAVTNMKEQTKKCMENIEKFRQLLLQIDEALLIRATRLDLK